MHQHFSDYHCDKLVYRRFDGRERAAAASEADTLVTLIVQ